MASLILVDNMIEHIEDDSFFELENLEILNLRSNKLQYFNQTFSSFLKTLILSENPLIHIKLSILTLEFLELYDTALDGLKNVSFLPNLKSLIISKNEFDEIQTVDIAHYCNLKKLWLSQETFEKTKTFKTCECERLKKWISDKQIKLIKELHCMDSNECSANNVDFSKEEKAWNDCQNWTELYLKIFPEYD